MIKKENRNYKKDKSNEKNMNYEKKKYRNYKNS